MQHPLPTSQWLSCAGKCSRSDSEADVLAASLGVGYGGGGVGWGGWVEWGGLLVLLLIFPPLRAAGADKAAVRKANGYD